MEHGFFDCKHAIHRGQDALFIRKLFKFLEKGRLFQSRDALLATQRMRLHSDVVRLLSRLLRWPLRLVPSGLTVPILSGPLRGWKWISGTATHGCWLGTYERETQDVLRRLLRDGDVVYDVGANAGFFSLFAAKLGCAVYAFEPLPENLANLRKHIALNGANVEVWDVALSSSSGVARFTTDAHPAMGRLEDRGELEVRTETLDRLVASGQIPPPRAMKIDVEGAEHDVLTGAAAVLARHRPMLLLSTHGYAIHERCMALLREFGYAIEIIRDGTADGQYTLAAR